MTRRRLTTGVTLVALLVVLCVMAVWGYHAATSPIADGSSSSASPTCKPEDQQVAKFLQRKDVTVSVYNAGKTAGRAQQTMGLLERAGFDARMGLGRETRRGVDRRMPRRQLRAADETGAKARGFRGGGRKVETSVFPFRRARRTDAAAIDARGFDADVEPAVEPAVLGFNGGVTDLDIKHRERI